MTKKTCCRLITIILALMPFGILPRPSWADATPDFEKIIPFTTATGRLGFFDKSNGNIFVYDENWKNCVFKGQLKTLGAPLETIAGTEASSLPGEKPTSGKNISIDEKGSKTITLSGEQN